MNQQHVLDMEHAIKNGAFYTDANNQRWTELVEKGYATKHPGWDVKSAYFKVTAEGRLALELTDYQEGKLIHCFGLDYANKPWRNHYFSSQSNDEWEDMIIKGYAIGMKVKDGIMYEGTLKALRKVYRRNISMNYFERIPLFQSRSLELKEGYAHV